MFDPEDAEIIVVGAGLSGAVIADCFARVLRKKVLVVEKRTHIGGNCYDYRDPETGILINKYGAHLFHTKSKRVWDYVTSFDQWIRWEHQVLSNVSGKLVSIPVNITSVNRLLGLNLETSEEMDQWLQENQVDYSSNECGGPKNSQEMCYSRVGKELTELMFRPYSLKQWNRHLEELAPEVCARIPVRNNFDTRYFSDKYQALPAQGYTHFFEKLLNHELIRVELGIDYLALRDIINQEIGLDGKKKHPNTNDYNLDSVSLDRIKEVFPKLERLFFTGPIDHFYGQLGFAKLEYRSLRFEIEKFENMNYFQPNSVVNYPGLDVPFTRIIEYKHFLHQKSPHTTIVKEYSAKGGPDAEPYYPIPNERNTELFKMYQKWAHQDQKVGESERGYALHFVGRLANYKYFNMDQAILNALELFDLIQESSRASAPPSLESDQTIENQEAL